MTGWQDLSWGAIICLATLIGCIAYDKWRAHRGYPLALELDPDHPPTWVVWKSAPWPQVADRERCDHCKKRFDNDGNVLIFPQQKTKDLFFCGGCAGEEN